MNPVVQSPGQTSEHPFGIEGACAISPSCENHFPFVGDAVVVRILEIEQVGNRTHEHSAAIAMDGRRPAQTLRKDGRVVKAAIAISVLQPPDLSGMLFALSI